MAGSSKLQLGVNQSSAANTVTFTAANRAQMWWVRVGGWGWRAGFSQALVITGTYCRNRSALPPWRFYYKHTHTPKKPKTTTKISTRDLFMGWKWNLQTVLASGHGLWEMLLPWVLKGILKRCFKKVIKKRSLKKGISLEKLLYYSYCHFIYFYFLAVPHSMWDLSSLTKDWACALCIGSMES